MPKNFLLGFVITFELCLMLIHSFLWIQPWPKKKKMQIHCDCRIPGYYHQIDQSLGLESIVLLFLWRKTPWLFLSRLKNSRGFVLLPLLQMNHAERINTFQFHTLRAIIPEELSNLITRGVFKDKASESTNESFQMMNALLNASSLAHPHSSPS